MTGCGRREFLGTVGLSAAASMLPGVLGAAAAAAADRPGRKVSWDRCLGQPNAWYGTGEAVRIADNVLLYQRRTGGWPKNTDMARPLSEKDKSKLKARKNRADSTIDNGATHTQMRYIARVYAATKHARFREAFFKATDALLAAQYPTGGWPQFFPKPSGYFKHITFNDGAMIGVLAVLRGVATGRAPYAFVDAARRRRAAAAVKKGIACILKCQIVVAGRRTAWCAQHDEKTLAPRPARTYEKASISGCESVGVVRFLMDIERPGREVIAAVRGAAAWFDRVKLTGIRLVTRPNKKLPRGFDKVIVKDPAAPPLWARFYQIGTNRPIFCGRDGKIKYRLAEIELERRTGYAWYGNWPARLLAKDYPAWRKKWAVGKNVPRR